MTDMTSSLQQLGQRAVKGCIAMAIILVALEFILHRHGKISMEALPLFPALFGLIGAIVVLGLGKTLAAILTVQEGYYDDE